MNNAPMTIDELERIVTSSLCTIRDATQIWEAIEWLSFGDDHTTRHLQLQREIEQRFFLDNGQKPVRDRFRQHSATKDARIEMLRRNFLGKLTGNRPSSLNRSDS